MTMTTPDRELVVERADAQPADRVLRVLIVTGDVPPPTRRFLRFVVRRILFQHIDKNDDLMPAR